jgi:hypothetical protein
VTAAWSSGLIREYQLTVCKDADEMKSTRPERSRSTSPILARLQAVKDATADELTPTARLVLRAVIDYCGNHDECWPAVSRLAAECGVSPRHCRRILRQLESAGWITHQSRHRSNGSQTSNLIAWSKDATAPDTDVRPPRTPMSAPEHSGEYPTEEHMPPQAECGSSEDVTTATPAEQPAPAPERRRTSPRYIRITDSSDEFRTPNEAGRVYQLAIDARLITNSDLDQLAFFTGWSAVCRKVRAGKCSNPAGMMRVMLQNPKSLRAYGTADDEATARKLIRRLYHSEIPERYNPFTGTTFRDSVSTP